ncbi:hypothetical protein Acr_00g0088250 [Actinidia rufa]|uniref:Uncharacterized protein n=1 Tax=Actinidia rufa TaxID=165716 RepID=A0A7J0DWM5_9ERIC|nr:hypothetical protein Acr_00g0088250 [Actinidia rufa]
MDTLEANAKRGREAFYKAGARLLNMDAIPMVNQADLEAIARLIEEFGWSGLPVYPLNPNPFQDALTLNQDRDLANGILVFSALQYSTCVYIGISI